MTPSTQSPNKNQTIANPQSPTLPKVKGPEMNDRDRANDILAYEKYIITMTNIAAWEASHIELHQDIVAISQETQAYHRDLFNLMFQKGWYKLEAADQQKLDQGFTQFSNYATQFPYPTELQ